MLDQPPQDLEAWVAFLSNAEIPILRQTARRLDDARQDSDRIGAREIAGIVLQDPLMAVRVLAYIQPIHGKHLRSAITTIGNAVVMLGVEPFFRTFAAPLAVETLLGSEPRALLGVLRVVRRAQRASAYAHDWAFERHDINIEEVTLAALLHDLAEILLWCFAPRQALTIRGRLDADHRLRSALAQQQVLGFTLADVQKALCAAWQLPELLDTLMDDANADLPRVQNVTLAVNLARHSANDWSDAALPDDLRAIGALLHVKNETLQGRLDIPAEAWLQIFPPQTPEQTEQLGLLEPLAADGAVDADPALPPTPPAL